MNFVIILADDQGYADAVCYGATDFETPNLDKMAQDGIRFTDFHVSQAVCSASRAALMTGCYSNRVSILGALMPWSENGINADEETIAEMLKKKGYATAVFGKWHLGHHEQFLPLQNGFDEYLGLPYSNDMWPVDFDGVQMSEKWAQEKEKNPDAKKPYKLNYPQLPLIDGNEKVAEIRTLGDQGTLTTRYTERAVKFIENNKDRPFFLYMPQSMPHVPLGVSDKFKGKSKQGMYGDVIMEIDWSVGQVLKALKVNGLEDNTLVVYTSDNGPWMNFGNHAGQVGPLREAKGTMWEGGARVPCIMRWPNHIEPGRVCDKLASTIDLLPTIAEIAGTPLPENKIDGVSITPILRGDKNANPRNEYYYYYGNELRAVRQGSWKLLFPHSYRSYENVKPGKDGWPGPYGKGTTGYALYNLETDIGERNDVYNQYPEIVERLMKLGEQARAELGDSLTKQNGSGVRDCGHVEKN